MLFNPYDVIANFTTLSSADDQWDFSTANMTSRVGVVDVAWVTLIGLLLGLVVFMTAAGNMIVVLAVALNAHLRTTTYYFIANLAVADLLVGVTVLPFSASLEVLDHWAFGQVGRFL